MALISLPAQIFITGESGMNKLHSVLILNCTDIPGCLYHQVTSFALITCEGYQALPLLTFVVVVVWGESLGMRIALGPIKHVQGPSCSDEKP